MQQVHKQMAKNFDIGQFIAGLRGSIQQSKYELNDETKQVKKWTISVSQMEELASDPQFRKFHLPNLKLAKAMLRIHTKRVSQIEKHLAKLAALEEDAIRLTNSR